MSWENLCFCARRGQTVEHTVKSRYSSSLASRVNPTKSCRSQFIDWITSNSTTIADKMAPFHLDGLLLADQLQTLL